MASLSPPTVDPFALKEEGRTSEESLVAKDAERLVIFPLQYEAVSTFVLLSFSRSDGTW